MSENDREIIRVLLMEIVAGDRKKFEARSNEASSGGGARDLRFRPSNEFFAFFKRMLPGRMSKNRPSKTGQTEIEVLHGVVYWDEGGSVKEGTVEVWPPTNARPGECRIAKISRYGLQGHIVDDENQGRSVFMMFQQADGVIRLYFTTETSLREENWDVRIKEFAGAWFKDDCKAAFLDLETGTKYPHV